jgi:hypothetical protein
MTMRKMIASIAIAVALSGCGGDTGQQLAQCKDQIREKSRVALMSSVNPLLLPMAMQMLEDKIGALPNTPEGVSQCRQMLAQR